ncbi:MAG TPA: PKD domain-containing protein [Gemmatimonadales bacterium]|nr:PKD domain-containing protein [Gemmatimonadales bacterium]
MRSFRMLAAVTSILALATACGDGGGTPPPDNQAPVASFSEVCTQLSCVFTDASTDPDEGGTIASRIWNFGEPASTTNTSTEQNPTHVYAAAGTYAVALTVTDNAGANSTPFTKSVTVTAPAPPVNAPPTAAFTFTCDEAGACTFNSATSTDTDGTIAAYAWNFGDPASGAANTSTEANPTHTYSVTQPTPFTVTLTVTDDDGAASAAATQTVTVNPPPSLVCSAGTPAPDGKPRVLCTLDVTQRSRLTFTMTSHDCELGGNKFEVTQPVQRTLFFNGCSEVLEPAGKEYPIMDADGTTPRVFDAGTQVQTRFTQGTPGTGSPPAGTPTIRLDGAWPTWTLNIDDGGNPGPGEPDFDDIVLTATATRVQ